MLVIKKIKDLMVDINEYPHIPCDTSIKTAIEVVKDLLNGKHNCYQPMIALVFDGQKLVGTLRLRDILKGLEPSYLQPSSRAQGHTETNAELAIIWDSLFDTEAKELAQRPVREVMNPIKAYVSPDDPVVKASYLMIHNDLLILPVLKDKKKVVGVIRMMEVFEALSGSILDDDERSNIIELKKFI